MTKIKKNKSFTLLELLVVIAIIGLIASIAIVSTRGGIGRARIAKTLQYEASLHRYLGSDIVGWWKFDEGEGTTVTDISGYNNHGTIVGATYVDGVPGKGGSALSFNGSNYVDTSVKINTTAFTVIFWVKINNLTYGYFLSQWQLGHLRRLVIYDDGNQIYFF